MQKRQWKKLMGVGLVLALCVMTACGKGETEDTPLPEATGTPASEQQGAEVTATPTPTEAPAVTETPVHVPAKNEGLEIPDEYRILREEASGTVEQITYTTKEYYGTEEEMTKQAYVYLPHGYDTEKQYNVIFLMHGGGSNEDGWGIHTKYSTVKLALDNLIYFGDIEPCIVVVPNGRAGIYYAKNGDDSEAFMGFGVELRNDLIPYIDANYATYGDYSPEGYDLTAARDHRAIAGFSFGGMQSINVGLCECLDIISYFGGFATATAVYGPEEIAKHLENFEAYDIGYLYALCGDGDTNCLWAINYALNPLPNLTDKVVMGENLMLQIIPGNHNMPTANLGFYNFLQLIFK